MVKMGDMKKVEDVTESVEEWWVATEVETKSEVRWSVGGARVVIERGHREVEG